MEDALVACNLPDAESFISFKKGFRASEKFRTKYAPVLGVAGMWRGLTDVLRVGNAMNNATEMHLLCVLFVYHDVTLNGVTLAHARTNECTRTHEHTHPCTRTRTRAGLRCL